MKESRYLGSTFGWFTVTGRSKQHMTRRWSTLAAMLGWRTTRGGPVATPVRLPPWARRGRE